jgi:hypothetical protein
MDILQRLESYLHNQGNDHLTLILLALVFIGFAIALFAPPEVKLLLITWWLLP